MRWALVSLFLACACGARHAPATPGDRSRLVAVAADDDEVVAEVDGIPIRASQVVVQARAAGTDGHAALSALIDAEVLAGAALRRGLADDEEVREGVRAAEVRRLLRRDFERDTPAEHIPEQDLKKLYDLNKLRYDRDEAREVWHLLARAPAASSSPAERAQARAAMVALRPRAVAAASDDAFAALAAADAGTSLKAEHLSFPRHGVVEDRFAEAAFAMHDPGQVSEVVESSYGYHLIRLVQVLRPRHVGLTEARAELLPSVWSSWRRGELDRWMRDLVERTHVEVFPEHLQHAEAAP
jgi:parvulin-like peptidyl-prolyl isomerase